MQQGFFSVKETQSDSRPDGKTYSCASCGLIKECKTPRMKPFGKFGKRILIVGGLPSEFDDQKGKPWQDSNGRFLQKELQEIGIDLFEDCKTTNAVNCYTPDKLDSYQIACCRKSLLKIIREDPPRIIVLFGLHAMESIIGHRWKKAMEGEDKWRGWMIPDQDFKAWIIPLFHPNLIISANKELLTTWRIDLQNIKKAAGTPFIEYAEPTIDIITDLSPLKEIKEGMVAFDYETTGIKPHSKGHRIICASVADSKDHAYVFMMPQTKEEREPFLDLLKNRAVKKIAQNMKFEEAWSLIRLRQSVRGWFWDTMLASHIFDNRPGITGLKFQVYVQFGIVDYSSEVSPFLMAKDNKNANAINKIEELIKTKEGRRKLMIYCGYDSVYEYRLALLQMDRMNMDILPF